MNSPPPNSKLNDIEKTTQHFTKELLLEFIRYHYKDNPFRKETTNEKDVDEFLEYRKPDIINSTLIPKDCECNLILYPDQLDLCGKCLINKSNP